MKELTDKKGDLGVRLEINRDTVGGLNAVRARKNKGKRYSKWCRALEEKLCVHSCSTGQPI